MSMYSLTSARPLCLLSQCSFGWGWPETLQDTDTLSPTDALSCSAETNTSGASEMKHPDYHDSNHLIQIEMFKKEKEKSKGHNQIKLTKDVKHDGSAILSYLVCGSADILSKVGPGNRPHSQLTAVWVEMMMWGVKCHWPENNKQKTKYTIYNIIYIQYVKELFEHLHEAEREKEKKLKGVSDSTEHWQSGKKLLSFAHKSCTCCCYRTSEWH